MTSYHNAASGSTFRKSIDHSKQFKFKFQSFILAMHFLWAGTSCETKWWVTLYWERYNLVVIACELDGLPFARPLKGPKCSIKGIQVGLAASQDVINVADKTLLRFSKRSYSRCVSKNRYSMNLLSRWAEQLLHTG